MNRDKLVEMYKKYNLTPEDVFKHQHYLIITRGGIEKIQAKEKIQIEYSVIKCEKDFCVVKAKATRKDFCVVKGKTTCIDSFIETFGSALKGASFKDGNCNSWYVMEMAEKRSMSRAVLKLTGFYSLGVFGEDESEDFKKQ